MRTPSEALQKRICGALSIPKIAPQFTLLQSNGAADGSKKVSDFPQHVRAWHISELCGQGGGGSPGLHKRIAAVKALPACRPRGRLGRPPRPVPDLPGLHPCRREGGALPCPFASKKMCENPRRAGGAATEKFSFLLGRGRGADGDGRSIFHSRVGYRMNAFRRGLPLT